MRISILLFLLAWNVAFAAEACDLDTVRSEIATWFDQVMKENGHPVDRSVIRVRNVYSGRGGLTMLVEYLGDTESYARFSSDKFHIYPVYAQVDGKVQCKIQRTRIWENADPNKHFSVRIATRQGEKVVKVPESVIIGKSFIIHNPENESLPSTTQCSYNDVKPLVERVVQKAAESIASVDYDELKSWKVTKVDYVETSSLRTYQVHYELELKTDGKFMSDIPISVYPVLKTQHLQPFELPKCALIAGQFELGGGWADLSRWWVDQSNSVIQYGHFTERRTQFFTTARSVDGSYLRSFHTFPYLLTSTYFLD